MPPPSRAQSRFLPTSARLLVVFGAIVASNPNPAFVLNLAHPPLPSNPSPPPYPLDHSICITAASSSTGPPALLFMWVVVAEVQSRPSRKDGRSSCT